MRRCLMALAAVFMAAAAASLPVFCARAGDEFAVGMIKLKASSHATLAQTANAPGLGTQIAGGQTGSDAGRSRPPYTAPIYSTGYGRAYGMRPGSTFTSGLIGGLLGAGLGGLLFGGGFFRAMHGAPGVLGVLLQLIVAYTIAVWLYRRFVRTLAPAGAGLYVRLFHADRTAEPGAAKPGFFGGGRTGRPITLSPADFRSFEELLHCVQTAWSTHDLNALRSMTTPAMADSYARQFAEQQLRRVRNQVTDVRLQKGDVCEAWSDGRRDHAIVAMSYSMLDTTLDGSGRLSDGSETERVSVMEYWRFIRTPRARWLLAAIEERK